MKENSKETLFDILASVKLAIFLLIALSVTSIFGTIIPQGEPINFYQERYNPTFFNLIKLFRLYDAYNSWWFLTLLNLFSINLICCTLKRLPFTLKLLKRDILDVDGEKITKMPLKNTIEIQKSGSIYDEIKKIFKDHKSKELTDGSRILAWEKGKINYLGVYVLHLSILVIFAGAIVGGIWGFKGNMMLLEGEKSNHIVNNRTSDEIQLPFEVRCNKFTVEFYEDGRTPKEFRSSLTIIEDNKEILTTDIIVNKPLKYKGITFYQSSYQAVPEISISIEKDNNSESITLSAFDTINIPNTELTMGILQFLPDVHGFPAARIWVTDGKDFTEAQWILLGRSKNFGQGTNNAFKLHLIDVNEKFMTGLQVKKDPGVWVVWLGCFGLVVGFVIVFWIPHRRIWILIEENKLTIAGQTNKNKYQFEREFEELTNKISKLNHKEG